MNEREVHLKLSDVKIDNDNLDYIKMTGEICGKLRDDLVKLFAVSSSVCSCGSPNYGYGFAKCYDCGKIKDVLGKVENLQKTDTIKTTFDLRTCFVNIPNDKCVVILDKTQWEEICKLAEK